MTKYSLAFLLFFFHAVSVISQKSLVYHINDEDFDKAYELFQKEKYGMARILFNEYITKNSETGSYLHLSEAAFYEALCATRLENEDMLYKWEKYLKDFPESNRHPYVYYYIGDYYLQKNRYGTASRWFKKVKPSGLDNKTKEAFFFKTGYALFMRKDYDSALSYFKRVPANSKKYHTSVVYYTSHILYEKGKYDKALKGFQELEDDKAFGKVVPFYIAQIYYLKKDYDKAIEYALPLTEQGSKKRQADMSRIVADSYFAKKEYKKAIPYYEKVLKLSDEPKREDYYHLGFSYYFAKNYQKAAENLSKVTSKDDQMSQNAYYHLGDCYLKMNDKKRARVAFEAASKYDFDKEIQEDAMLNYIKLNYELSYSPFNEIINSFLKFIEMFPNSDKIDQAYEYLGKAFLTTKNYREALQSMEKIKQKTPTVYRAMQRVALFRGLELFTDLNYNDAIDFFTYSLKYGDYDKSLKLKALYWRGEAYYRTGDYENAKKDYLAFIHTPGSYTMEEFKTAHYNIGYVFFKQKNYNQAKVWFNKFLKLKNNYDRVMIGDALNRLGDCYYVERDFKNAIAYYDRAAEYPESAADYALFQKGFCLGLQKKYNQKISVLKALVNQYPKSPYVDDAYYEIGKSYVALNDLPRAIRNYKIVKEKFPRSNYARKAMLQLGLVYYNNGDYENSKAFYKRVVNEFPGTPEAMDALVGLRNVYMEENNLDGYLNFANSLGGFAKVEEREKDSLSFVAAEKLYMKGDCPKAVSSFKKYIRNFPKGMFLLNAHFYKADCQYRAGEYDEALQSYEYVANREQSLFTEEALLRTGEIYYMNKNYEKALTYFQRLEEEGEREENRLEARIGEMRCYKKLKRYRECITASEKVLLSPKLSDEIKREALFNKGISYLESGDTDSALGAFRQVANNTKSKEGAQAKYLIAEIYYSRSEPGKAEKEIFSFIDKGTPHQYWLARAFVLLADIYHDRGENFQAIQYLESLRENYKGDDDIQDMVDKRISVWSAEDKQTVDSVKTN
ncbi:MAG: tetratricopeptide repeat protein [Chlorobi bacterium]|nr:tetratricopeptide repeat protein [Chlorobiota bacterium]